MWRLVEKLSDSASFCLGLHHAHQMVTRGTRVDVHADSKVSPPAQKNAR